MRGRLMQVGNGVRSALSIHSGTKERLSSLRVGLSVTLPVLGLLAAGRQDLSIYAVFGAFTGMYGRDERHQLRLYHQLVAAVLLISGVMVGAILSTTNSPHWVLVTIEASFAAVGSLIADRANLKPVGPFFGIFALGACASIPPITPLLLIFGVVTGAAAISIFLGFAGSIRAWQWEPGARRMLLPLTGLRLRTSLVHAFRYVLAISTAGSVGQVTEDGHAYWAMAAAAVPLAGADFAGRIRRGIHRITGTVAGLGVTAVILHFHPDAVTLAILVAVFQFPTELFMARHYGIALVFFTPLILMMTILAHPSDTNALITARAIETVLGAVIGMAVVILVKARTNRTKA